MMQIHQQWWCNRRCSWLIWRLSSRLNWMGDVFQWFIWDCQAHNGTSRRTCFEGSVVQDNYWRNSGSVQNDSECAFFMDQLISWSHDILITLLTTQPPRPHGRVWLRAWHCFSKSSCRELVARWILTGSFAFGSENGWHQSAHFQVFFEAKWPENETLKSCSPLTDGQCSKDYRSTQQGSFHTHHAMTPAAPRK